MPAGKVRTLDEVYAWDQTASQGLLVEVEHPTLGPLTLPGPPLRFFDGDGAEVTRRDHDAPPILDEDGPAIRAWLRGRVMARRPWTAHELLDLVLDAGSFESWDEPIDISGQPEDYRRQLEAAAAKAGTDESVLTGRGRVRGRPVAVVVNEFRFLAGSIGRAAAERITAAVRRATAEGLPVLATTASGGTRMQEGTPAFVQMVEISRALMAHRAAGLPYLVHLRHPTTGGVYASWGSLGHVTVAEPGALVGFLGPQGLRGAQRRAVPDGRPAGREPRRQGRDRRRRRRRGPAELVDRALGVLVDPPDRAAPAAPRRGAARRPAPPGSRSESPADPTGRRARPAAARRHRHPRAQRHRARASATRPCS